MMNFWTGLFFGWIIGSIGTGIILMFFAGIKRNDDWLDDDRAYDLEEKLKGRRE